MTAGLIEVAGLRKAYGPTVALDDVTHTFAPGRVHALMGKNGSGKSTLVKLLAGAVQPDAGTIRVNGRAVTLASPADALANRIVTVHQELSLVAELSVAENIYLGRLPYTKGLPRIDWGRVRADATALLDDMGLDVDPRRQVSSFSVGRQQVIEIAKAMSFDPTILLLDEPTSALAQAEVEHLFALVERLRARGVTMVYITHRMSELFDVADTCTVLRDGRLVGSIEMADATPEGIVEMMFGDVARAVRPPSDTLSAAAPAVLEVRGLSRKGAFEDVSFDLKRGEILGFAGMLGAGRTEVLRAIFGADPFDSGTIVLDGETVTDPTPVTMKARGVGYTPENRKEVGLVQPLPVHDNLCMASMRRIAPSGIVTRAAEAPYVSRQIEDLAIKVADPMQPASTLSGGNQQKIVIGNWLNTEPKVMFFDEPSRGIDVQAKQQIFEIMWREAEAGISSIFVSTEAEELLEVCDRILVMRGGRIVEEVLPHETSIAELYALCMEPKAAEDADDAITRHAEAMATHQ